MIQERIKNKIEELFVNASISSEMKADLDARLNWCGDYPSLLKYLEKCLDYPFLLEVEYQERMNVLHSPSIDHDEVTLKWHNIWFSIFEKQKERADEQI